jgi:hypothetical protein
MPVTDTPVAPPTNASVKVPTPVAPTSTPEESGAPLAPTDTPGTPGTDAPTKAPKELDIGYCGDYYCIPDGDECPMDSMPKTEFSEDLLDTLATITLKNPILLSCNPYTKDLGNGTNCKVSHE